MKLQLWDTGGMERVASITSSYYKYSEAAILVFALDRHDTFHVLAQHLLVRWNFPFKRYDHKMQMSSMYSNIIYTLFSIKSTPHDT